MLLKNSLKLYFKFDILTKNFSELNMYKVNDLIEITTLFLDKVDDEGRYLSYNYCYNYFNDNYKTNNNDKKNEMTLYLYAYLASWGMLRNSFLLYKSPFFSRKVIDILCEEKSTGNNTPIETLKENIINAYKYKDINAKPIDSEDNINYYYKEEMKKAVSPTSIDTLVSKIILGTLGTVPAYDRFFKITAENMGLCQTLNTKSLNQLQKFIDANKDDIDKIIKDNKLNYTPMKIVDIYFWQKAYNLSPIHRIVDLSKKDYSAKINKQINEQIEKCKTLNQTWYNKLINSPLKNKDDYKNIISICEKIKKDYYNDAIVIDLQNYQDKDYDFVYETKKALYKDYVIQNWGKWKEKDQKDFFEKYIKANKEHIYILTSGNTKIGFIDYNIGQNIVDIGNLCINKEYQGKGIGSRILEEIINKNLDKTISLQVFIQNERAIKLYNKLGFKISSSSNTHHTMILEPRN